MNNTQLAASYHFNPSFAHFVIACRAVESDSEYLLLLKATKGRVSTFNKRIIGKLPTRKVRILNWNQDTEVFIYKEVVCSQILIL